LESTNRCLSRELWHANDADDHELTKTFDLRSILLNTSTCNCCGRTWYAFFALDLGDGEITPWDFLQDLGMDLGFGVFHSKPGDFLLNNSTDRRNSLEIKHIK